VCFSLAGGKCDDFAMTMYDEGVQTYGAMFLGFGAAAARFTDAVERGEPLGAYVALFEALNWAVVLDDRTASMWVPDGEVLGWAWRDRIAGAEMLRGVRFARNSMHHDWSEVLERGEIPNGEAPRVLQEWTWRPVDRLPSRGKEEADAEAVYVDQLAGRMVRSTLVGLISGFGLLRELLEPSLVRPRI
jgi:hypothetical protein